MGDLVNLNHARKARDKKARDRQAAANRMSFGRDKAERQRAADDQGRIKKELDGKTLNAGDSTSVEKDSEPKPSA